MAILGKIRQRSIILIIVIAMALFAFVISGAITQPGVKLGLSKPIAKVNKEEIETQEFKNLVEQLQRTRPGITTMQAVDLIWDELIQTTLLDLEFGKLGIDVGPEQLERLMKSNPQISASPLFQNDLGEFDFQLFRQHVSNLRVSDPISYENWKTEEDNLIAIAKLQVYNDLLQASSIQSESQAKLLYQLEQDNVTIEFVLVPYDHVADSLVEVSDEELLEYYNENKQQYQEDPYRSIQFVSFEDVATEQDEGIIRARVESLIEERVSFNNVSKLTDTLEGFRETKDIRDFVDRNSEQPFDSIYVPKGDLNSEYADILFELDEGEVFGPYKDGNDYKISRLISRRDDGNIRASHILISFQGAQNAAEDMLRSKDQAEILARDLLRKARANPDSFFDLAIENSDGPARTRGGDLGFFQEGEMVDPFFEFCDSNRVGTIGFVETQFGYHVVEIVEKDDLVLLANVVAEVVPSNDTSSEVFRRATQFEMEVKEDPLRFEELASDKSYDISDIEKLYSMESSLLHIDQLRSAVQWVYDKSTKVNDIQRFNHSGGYVVVQVTGINEDGIPEFEDVSYVIERELEEKKRADIIESWYGDIEILDDLVDQSEEFEIQKASALNQRNATIVGAGEEPLVVGVAFGLEVDQVSDFIVGNEGVYKIRVLEKSLSEPLDDYRSYVIGLSDKRDPQRIQEVIDAIKETATIEDNRLLYY